MWPSDPRLVQEVRKKNKFDLNQNGSVHKALVIMNVVT